MSPNCKLKASQGLPRANEVTAVATIFDAETGSVLGVENLDLAAKIMAALSRPVGSKEPA